MLSFQAIGLALMLLAPFNGAEFIRVCGLDQVSIVAITKDQTGQYVFVNDRAMVKNGPTSSPSNVNRRLLRQQEQQQQQQQHSFEAAISVQQQQQQQSRSLQSNSSSVIYVRECICSYSEVKTYCPVDLNICGIRSEKKNSHVGYTTGCFAESSKTFLVRNSWPIVIIWFATLVLFLFCTDQGRNALRFCWNRCCDPNMNDRIIERRIQPLSVQAIMWAHRMRLAQQQHHMTNDRIPHELVLKTKLFHVQPNISHTEEGDIICTICFHTLQEGDRVGALPCHHDFHVECLKGWLIRRNVCPLCQAPDVALPRYREHPHDDSHQHDDSHGVADVVPSDDTFLVGSQGTTTITTTTATTSSVNDIAQPIAERRDTFRGRVLIRR